MFNNEANKNVIKRMACKKDGFQNKSFTQYMSYGGTQMF